TRCTRTANSSPQRPEEGRPMMEYFAIECVAEARRAELEAEAAHRRLLPIEPRRPSRLRHRLAHALHDLARWIDDQQIGTEPRRGVLAWPMDRLQSVPIGALMARIVGDVEVLGVGVREFTIEMWDTVLFEISLAAAMFLIDGPLTLAALAPVPIAMLIAHAT